MTRKEKATQLYTNGYNCAQTIIKTYEDFLGNRTQTLVDMAAGFGGGMGKLQQTCGAVTGAFMVMSSVYNHSQKASKDQLNKDIQQFARRFNNIHGKLNCAELIEYDLKDEREHQKAKENKVFEKQCSGFIHTAIDIIEELMQQSQQHINAI